MNAVRRQEIVDSWRLGNHTSIESFAQAIGENPNTVKKIIFPNNTTVTSAVIERKPVEKPQEPAVDPKVLDAIQNRNKEEPLEKKKRGRPKGSTKPKKEMSEEDREKWKEAGRKAYKTRMANQNKLANTPATLNPVSIRPKPKKFNSLQDLKGYEVPPEAANMLELYKRFKKLRNEAQNLVTEMDKILNLIK